MIKWMAITFGILMALMVLEYQLARRKKGGLTYTDRQRIIGIFWVSVFVTGLVGALIWMSPE